MAASLNLESPFVSDELFADEFGARWAHGQPVLHAEGPFLSAFDGRRQLLDVGEKEPYSAWNEEELPLADDEGTSPAERHLLEAQIGTTSTRLHQNDPRWHADADVQETSTNFDGLAGDDEEWGDEEAVDTGEESGAPELEVNDIESAADEYESWDPADKDYETNIGLSNEGFEPDLDQTSFEFDSELFQRLLPFGQLIEQASVATQVATGKRDVNELTNMVFFMRHPELRGTSLGKGQELLMAEWRQIRDEVVRPALAKAASGRNDGAGVAPSEPTTTLRKAIVATALKELEIWEQGKLTEKTAKGKEHLARYWSAVFYNNTEKIQHFIKENHAWSAAFVSWVMKEAGADKSFDRHHYHTGYIAGAKINRRRGDNSKFQAYRINEVAVEEGDIVCKDRGSPCAGTTYDNVDIKINEGKNWRLSHGDIVVRLDSVKHEAYVIGGNVNDSVSMSETPISLTEDDRLPSKRRGGCAYIAVIKPPGVPIGKFAAAAAPVTPRSSSGSQLPRLAYLGAGQKPPLDPGAFRKFRLTTYHVVDQAEHPTGAIRIPILDVQGRKIAEGSPAFFGQLSLEGTARLVDGRLINVTGKDVSVDNADYAEVLAYHRQAYAGADRKRRERGKGPTPTRYSGIVVQNDRVVRAFAFHEVPVASRGFGYGTRRGIPHTPFRTLAADIGIVHAKYDKVEPKWRGKGGLVPPGTQVYIKEYDGLKLPDGTTHDGWFVVNDTGGAIFGAHFDVFTGTRALRKRLKLPEFGQVWFAGIESRIPVGYDRGLTKW